MAGLWFWLWRLASSSLRADCGVPVTFSVLRDMRGESDCCDVYLPSELLVFLPHSVFGISSRGVRSSPKRANTSVQQEDVDEFCRC